MKAFFRAIFTITAFSVLTKLLSFLLKIFLSRKVGAEYIGMIQVASSICMIFITLSTSGLNLIISKSTSENAERKIESKTFSLITACIMIALMVAGICTSFVLIFSSQIKSVTQDKVFTLLLYMLPCLFSVSISSALTGYFWGKKKYLANSFSDFFEQFLKSIFCLVLVSVSTDDFNGAVFAVVSMSIACFISTILNIILYKSMGGKFAMPHKKDFSYLIKKSLPITAVRFINSFTHPLIAIIVPLKLESIGFSSSKALSMFGIFQGMTLPLIFMPMMIIGAVSTVLIPDIVAYYTKKFIPKCQNIINLNISVALFVTCLILPLFTALGEPIGIFLFDNTESGMYLIKSAWIMIPVAINSISSSILNVLNKEKKSSINFVLGTITLIFAIIILPDYIDILSIPYGLGISMIVSSLLNIKVIKKDLNFSFNILKPLTTFLLFGIPTYFFTSLLYSVMNNYFTVFYSLIVSGGLGAMFFLTLCYVFKIVDISVVMGYKEILQN